LLVTFAPHIKFHWCGFSQIHNTYKREALGKERNIFIFMGLGQSLLESKREVVMVAMVLGRRRRLNVMLVLKERENWCVWCMCM
jgi:hypothetical protein